MLAVPHHRPARCRTPDSEMLILCRGDSAEVLGSADERRDLPGMVLHLGALDVLAPVLGCASSLSK